MNTRNIRNKIIIIIAFIFLAIATYFFTNTSSNSKLTNEQAKEKINEIFSDNEIKRIENQSLVLTKNDDYMIMVIKDQYILTDFSTQPPTIHHFESIKEDIKVKVLEIHDDGYLVEHDDHTHFVTMDIDENIEIGDYIYIKDPHTYIDDHYNN